MKVLVLGASGFIGLPVALAFARAGHIVYGTARDAKAARKLAIHEIIPVVTPATAGHGFSVWSKIAVDVDVVVDTIRSSDSDTPLAALRGVEEIGSRGTAGVRVTYIFTGSAWSHSRGNGGLDKWSSEQQPPASELEVSGWQREVEAAVLSSPRVNGIIIRPGTLYGRSGSILEPFLLAPAYDAAKAGREFDAIGLPDTRLLMVHQDDLADLYLRAGERGPLLAGTALVATNAQSERWTDILDAVVRVSGAKGYRLRPPSDKVPAEVAWATTTLLRPTLAHSLTGWTPRKPGLVDGIDSYWPSFVAHYEGKKTMAAWDLPGVVPVGGDSLRPTHSPKSSGSPPRSSPLAG